MSGGGLCGGGEGDETVTVRELIDLHEKERDEKFRKRYPRGRFMVQRDSYSRWDGNQHVKCQYIAIGWEPMRPSHGCRHRGVYLRNVGPHGDMNYIPCAFGKVWYYPTLEQMRTKATAEGMPTEKIELLDARLRVLELERGTR